MDLQWSLQQVVMKSWNADWMLQYEAANIQSAKRLAAYNFGINMLITFFYIFSTIFIRETPSIGDWCYIIAETLFMGILFNNTLTNYQAGVYMLVRTTAITVLIYNLQYYPAVKCIDSIIVGSIVILVTVYDILCLLAQFWAYRIKKESEMLVG